MDSPDCDQPHAGTAHVLKTRLLLALAFLFACCQSTVALGLLFYVRETFSASPSQIGILAGAWSIFYMLACTFRHRVAGWILPRYSILCAALSLSLILWSITRASTFTSVFVLYSAQGALTSLFWPALMGWLSAGLEGPLLSRTIGGFNLSWSTGTIFSPLIAGRLSDMNAASPLLLGSLGYLTTGIAMATAIIIFPSLRSDDHAHSHESTTSAQDDGGTPLRFPAWLGLFTGYAAVGVLINVFPVIGRDVLFLSRTDVGGLLFLRAAATTFGLGLFRHTTWWHFNVRQMQWGLLLFALLFVGFATTQSRWCIGAAMLLSGLLTAQAYVNSLFHGVTGSVRRASRMACHEAILAAGLFAGSAAGGRIYQNAGERSLYLATAGLLFIAAIVQGIVAKGNRTAPHKDA